MPFEYAVWAKTPVWQGQSDERLFPPLIVAPEIVTVLTSAVVPPPYRGGTPKEYANRFHQLFLHFDSKLLSPANARAVAAWLRDWSAQPQEQLEPEQPQPPQPESRQPEKQPKQRRPKQPAPASASEVRAHALRTATWLERAADAGWYIDWTAY